jgi:hypothetical protein
MATPTSLPATFVAGDVLTAAQQNGLRGGFRILQFLSASSTTPQTIATSTYTDLTSFSISITPQATTNKILVVYMTTMEKSVGNASNGVNLRFLRDATTIGTWANGLFTNSALRVISPANFMYLDSPATTSAITYKVQAANVFNGSEISFQQGSSPGSMYLLEVSL